MENNENKFHYLTALLLGVVGLLIILIFVSLRSQADDTTRLAETTVTNTAPSVGDITLTGGLYAGGTMDPALGPANVTSDTNSDLTVTFDYTDLNSCMTVDVDGSFFVRLNKSGESCGASQTDYDTCYEEDTTAAGTFACTDDCQDNDDTAATVECVFPITHFAEPGAWDVTVAVVDEGSGTDSATTSFTMATNNAITLHASDTSLNFGSLGLGASTTTVSGTPVSTRVRDIGNTDMALSVSAPDFNCSIQDNDSFVATKLKTKATTGTATETYTNMTSVTNAGADLSTTLSDQSAVTTITEDTHYETLYWGIEVPATGVAGTCTTTVTIIGSPA